MLVDRICNLIQWFQKAAKLLPTNWPLVKHDWLLVWEREYSATDIVTPPTLCPLPNNLSYFLWWNSPRIIPHWTADLLPSCRTKWIIYACSFIRPMLCYTVYLPSLPYSWSWCKNFWNSRFLWHLFRLMLQKNCAVLGTIYHQAPVYIFLSPYKEVYCPATDVCFFQWSSRVVLGACAR